MTEPEDLYQNPLVNRYASREMSHIFSDKFKFTTWRKLWLWLAEAEKSVGLNITDEQISSMQNNIENIDFQVAKDFEKELRHDVMAHLKTFGLVAKQAAPIMHLGATSAYVGDNTDLIVIKEAMKLVTSRLVSFIFSLRDRALRLSDMPCIGYTHFQPAQPTTVGKRLCLYLQDLAMDYEAIDHFIQQLPFRGIKGATGNQTSFLELMGGNRSAVDKIQNDLLQKSGFKKILTISGQTYTRKIDSQASSLLSHLAESLSKFASDFRLMQHIGEWEEGMEINQIGSSAMPYKQNPMKSERICSLSRFVMSLPTSLSITASSQWFERTLDDSANKRLAIPQAFLAVDSMLILATNIAKKMKVFEYQINQNLMKHLPFFMTENILMEGVKKGGNRQELHEIIRKESFLTIAQIKEGGENNLVKRLQKRTEFGKIEPRTWERLSKPNRYIGRATELSQKFITKELDPLLSHAKENGYADNHQDIELKV